MARLLVITLLLLSLVNPCKAVTFATDCLYLYENGKSLKGVKVTVTEEFGSSSVSSDGIYWVKQRPNQSVKLTFNWQDKSVKLAIPVPKDKNTHDSPPPGMTGGTIGSRRFFKVDLAARTVTPTVSEIEKVTKLPKAKGEERLPYLVHLLGGIMVLTLFIVIFGFGGSTSAPAEPEKETEEKEEEK